MPPLGERLPRIALHPTHPPKGVGSTVRLPFQWRAGIAAREIRFSIRRGVRQGSAHDARVFRCAGFALFFKVGKGHSGVIGRDEGNA